MPKIDKAEDQTHGIWEHKPADGEAVRREAANAAEAVKFAYDGWTRIDKVKDETPSS